MAFGGGRIYIGGSFEAVGDQQRTRLAAIDTAGVLADWNPNADNAVTALAVDGKGLVYVAGSFLWVRNAARSGLAAIDAAGKVTSWNPSPDGFGVSALVLSGNGAYVGGPSIMSAGRRAIAWRSSTPTDAPRRSIRYSRRTGRETGGWTPSGSRVTRCWPAGSCSTATRAPAWSPSTPPATERPGTRRPTTMPTTSRCSAVGCSWGESLADRRTAALGSGGVRRGGRPGSLGRHDRRRQGRA